MEWHYIISILFFFSNWIDSQKKYFYIENSKILYAGTNDVYKSISKAQK